MSLIVLTQSVDTRGLYLLKKIECFIKADIRGFIFFFINGPYAFFFMKGANFFKINLQVSLNNEE